MNSGDLQLLIVSRLEDMAEQVERLYNQGNLAEAELLREEGLQLANAFDNQATFMFINDLRHAS